MDKQHDYNASPQNKNTPPPQPLWRNRDYRLLWCGDAISALGSQASQLALPLLLLALTASPAQAGLLGALRGAIYLVCGLPAGVLIDRWHRRTVMVVADTLHALAFASIPLALLFGRLTANQIYVVAAIEGIGFIVFGLAHTASFTRIVPHERLPAALAQSQLIDSAARTIGPAIGGALFALAWAFPFTADAISYAFSVGTILSIHTALGIPRVAQRPTLLHDLLAGLRWLQSQPTLRAHVALNGAVNFVYGGFPLLVIELAQRLGAGGGVTGLIFALGGVGTLLGATLAPLALRRCTVGRLVTISMWLFGGGWLPYLLAPNLLVLGIAVVFALACAALYNSTTIAYRMLCVPELLQGRVFSVARLITYTAQAGGYLLVGLLLEHYGALVTTALLIAPSLLLAIATTRNSRLRATPRLAEVGVAHL